MPSRADARTVHFNFMARGEPLANPVLLERTDELLGDLAQRAVALSLRPRYLVSTIFPRELGPRSAGRYLHHASPGDLLLHLQRQRTVPAPLAPQGAYLSRRR